MDKKINQKNAYDICIYSHFDNDNAVQEYVLEAIKRINDDGFGVIFVTTSKKINDEDIEKIKKYCLSIIIRENIGYDFGSYKAGFEYVVNSNIKYSKILFTNDSVYGPFCSLKKQIELLKKYDIVGVTDSFDTHYHLQSYFLLFGEIASNSKEFRSFWDSVEYIPNDNSNFKNLIIQKYEIGGSQSFISKGFKLGASNDSISMFNKLNKIQIEKMQNAKINNGSRINFYQFRENMTHFYWDLLLMEKCPYIKRELIARNPLNIDISKWPNLINELTSYPLELIVSALMEYTKSTDFAFTTQKININEMSKDGTIILTPQPLLAKYIKNLPRSKVFHFDEEFYLEKNIDVKNAVMLQLCNGAIDHFISSGHYENRQINFSSTKIKKHDR